MQFDAVERRRRDGAEPRVLAGRRVLRELPQLVAAAESLVNSRCGESVEARDGRREAVLVDAEFRRKFVDRVSALDPLGQGAAGRKAREREAIDILLIERQEARQVHVSAL